MTVTLRVDAFVTVSAETEEEAWELVNEAVSEWNGSDQFRVAVDTFDAYELEDDETGELLHEL